LVQDVRPHHAGASVGAAALVLDLDAGMESLRFMDGSKSAGAAFEQFGLNHSRTRIIERELYSVRIRDARLGSAIAIPSSIWCE